jgi:hypothetical protein
VLLDPSVQIHPVSQGFQTSAIRSFFLVVPFLFRTPRQPIPQPVSHQQFLVLIDVSVGEKEHSAALLRLRTCRLSVYFRRVSDIHDFFDEDAIIRLPCQFGVDGIVGELRKPFFRPPHSTFPFTVYREAVFALVLEVVITSFKVGSFGSFRESGRRVPCPRVSRDGVSAAKPSACEHSRAFTYCRRG